MSQAKRIPLYLSLHQSIRHWATYQPAKPALIEDDASISYRALQCGISKCRALISDLHLSRQTPVGILVVEKSKLIAAVSAALAEGHVPVLLNLWLEPQILRSMILDACCKAVMVDLAGERLAKASAQDLPRTSVPDFSADNIRMEDDRQAEERFVDDEWGIIYTSGTTGTPKGIVRSDLSMFTELVGWCLELPITSNSIAFIGRPVYYTGGLVLTAATLLVGGSVILPHEWSVAAYKSLMNTNVVDFAFLIPDQVRELIGSRLADASNWAGPRRILTMGAPMPESLKRSVQEVLKCEYIESWGNSEGLGTITSELDARVRPTSIGRPFLSDELLVVDEDARPLPKGSIGRIAGWADSVLTKYQNREDLDRRFIRDRMVISEDLGYVDSDDYLYLVGRVSQRIVRKGEPIFATDIENIIICMQRVREVAVIGVHDAAEGEVPVAAVALKGEASENPDKFLAVANSKLLPQQQLKRVYLVSGLPRNAAGKVDYGVLRERLDSLGQPSSPLDGGD